MTRRTLCRGLLLESALAALVVGIPATVAPHAFYAHFPFLLTHWVDVLGPYDEHLVTDIGELQLGFGLLLGWAALRPERRLVIPLGIGDGVAGLLHLGFHLTHTGGLSVLSLIVELAGLTATAGLPLAAALLLATRA